MRVADVDVSTTTCGRKKSGDKPHFVTVHAEDGSKVTSSRYSTAAEAQAAADKIGAEHSIPVTKEE